jgi:hypothetical protein
VPEEQEAEAWGVVIFSASVFAGPDGSADRSGGNVQSLDTTMS